MVRSFAQGRFTQNFLAERGIRPSGVIWRWHLGLQGGVFEEHRDLNKIKAENEFAFPDHHHPDTDVNARYCQCLLQTVWRDDRGRFAKSNPVTASMSPQVEARLAALEKAPDLGAIMAAASPQTISVTIPDGAIVVNVPKADIPAPEIVVNVPKADTPIVNVAAPEVTVAAPNVTVEGATINVEPTPVNVQASEVTLEPIFQPPQINVEVPPTPQIQLPVAPTRESKYLSATEGKAAIPAGYAVASVSCECEDKPGSLRIGTGPLIKVPQHTAFEDDFESAPIKARSITFKDTVTYYVRLVPVS